MSQMRFASVLIPLSLCAGPIALAETKAAGGGKPLNPDISANILTLYQKSNRGNAATSASPNGFALQETEIQFTADVDPYLRASALLSIAPTSPQAPTEFG